MYTNYNTVRTYISRSSQGNTGRKCWHWRVRGAPHATPFSWPCCLLLELVKPSPRLTPWTSYTIEEPCPRSQRNTCWLSWHHFDAAGVACCWRPCEDGKAVKRSVMMAGETARAPDAEPRFQASFQSVGGVHGLGGSGIASSTWMGHQNVSGRGGRNWHEPRLPI